MDYEAAVEIRDAIAGLTREVQALRDAVLTLGSLIVAVKYWPGPVSEKDRDTGLQTVQALYEAWTQKRP